MISRSFKMAVANGIKLIDIGCNLTDYVFRGCYNGKQAHPDDISDVLERAWSNGVDKILITGDSLTGSQEALRICELAPKRLFATVGCHPTRSKQWQSDPDKYYSDLDTLTKENRDKVVAIGECGLDYDRIHFATADEQKIGFRHQLRLAAETDLPLFLHLRAAHRDWMEIYKEFERERAAADSTTAGEPASTVQLRGVVHSFTGTSEELDELLTKTQFYIGLNGCSFKTAENVSVARRVPLERLLIETDAPYCEIKSTHAAFSFVKTKFDSCKKEKFVRGMMVRGRFEPAGMVQVLEAIAGIKELPIEQVAHATYENTLNLFFRSNVHLKDIST